MGPFLKGLKPSVLAAATFHQYGSCGHDAIPHSHTQFPPVSVPGFALQPICLDKPEATIPGLAALVCTRAVDFNASSLSLQRTNCTSHCTDC
eukprot:SAG22_NODE_613_length_8567_cov_4.215163_6_plen_92_part_00